MTEGDETCDVNSEYSSSELVEMREWYESGILASTTHLPDSALPHACEAFLEFARNIEISYMVNDIVDGQVSPEKEIEILHGVALIDYEFGDCGPCITPQAFWDTRPKLKP